MYSSAAECGRITMTVVSATLCGSNQPSCNWHPTWVWGYTGRSVYVYLRIPNYFYYNKCADSDKLMCLHYISSMSLEMYIHIYIYSFVQNACTWHIHVHLYMHQYFLMLWFYLYSWISLLSQYMKLNLIVELRQFILKYEWFLM